MNHPKEAPPLVASPRQLFSRMSVAIVLGCSLIGLSGCFGEDPIENSTGTTSATGTTATTGTTSTTGTTGTTGTAPPAPSGAPPVPPTGTPPAGPPGAPPSRSAMTRAPKSGGATNRATRAESDPFFFTTQQSLGNDIYYSPDFGYYYLGYYGEGQKFIYKYGFGYLYYVGDDGADGDYFYDYKKRDYMYTSDRLYDYDQVTYFYSFNRRAYLYYYEDLIDTNARRFYDFTARRVITY